MYFFFMKWINLGLNNMFFFFLNYLNYLKVSYFVKLILTFCKMYLERFINNNVIAFLRCQMPPFKRFRFMIILFSICRLNNYKLLLIVWNLIRVLIKTGKINRNKNFKKCQLIKGRSWMKEPVKYANELIQIYELIKILKGVF